eukprot:COSAG05_NODE_580_length_8553_cov_197.460934_3_plen_291_part_00
MHVRTTLYFDWHHTEFRTSSRRLVHHARFWLWSRFQNSRSRRILTRLGFAFVRSVQLGKFAATHYLVRLKPWHFTYKEGKEVIFKVPSTGWYDLEAIGGGGGQGYYQQGGRGARIRARFLLTEVRNCLLQTVLGSSRPLTRWGLWFWYVNSQGDTLWILVGGTSMRVRDCSGGGGGDLHHHRQPESAVACGRGWRRCDALRTHNFPSVCLSLLLACLLACFFLAFSFLSFFFAHIAWAMLNSMLTGFGVGVRPGLDGEHKQVRVTPPSPSPLYLSWMPLAYAWGIQVEYT